MQEADAHLPRSGEAAYEPACPGYQAEDGEVAEVHPEGVGVALLVQLPQLVRLLPLNRRDVPRQAHPRVLQTLRTETNRGFRRQRRGKWGVL